MATSKNTKTAASKSAKPSMKYFDLIQRTDSEISKEAVELNVDMAKNTLEQGTLSVKQQMLGEQSKVKQAEINVSQAEQSLNAAKAAQPLNVQTIINRRNDLLQAKINLETAVDTLGQVKDTYDYLVALNEELF